MTAKELKIKHLLERIAAEQEKINERKGIIKVYEKELLKLGYEMPKSIEPELYPLIDRLQKCSEAKHPSQKWTNEHYRTCLFRWIGDIDKLKKLVEKLESELTEK